MPRDEGSVIHSFDTVSSTQSVALDLLETGRASLGHIVVANQQTTGRGRLGRIWASPYGGLYATFIVPDMTLLSLRAGVAAARALEGIGVATKLRWPNDLLIGERKLGGILIETGGDTARAGVGINISTSPAPGATSLHDLGIRGDRDAIVRAIYSELTRARPDDEILSEYRVRSGTLGRQVRIEVTAGLAIEGLAIGIDALGRLLVETENGVDAVTCGDCLHVATAPTRPD